MKNDLSLIDDFNMKDDSNKEYFDKHIDDEIKILEKFELLNDLISDDKKKNNA